jgi:hypothetical protein
MISTKNLAPFLSKLTNLTTINFDRLVISYQLLTILGKLENLTSLTYNITFPYELLLVEMPHEFMPQPKPTELPQKLQSLTVDFLTPDEEEVAFDIFGRIVEASASSLRSLKLDLHDIRSDLPVGAILQMDLISLTHLYLYNIDIFWSAFTHFHERHSTKLQVAEIVLRVWPTKPDEDSVDDEDDEDDWTSHYTDTIDVLPLLEDLEVEEPAIKKFANRGIISHSMRMEKDPAAQYTASEFAMIGGTWSVLRFIGEKHPFLRVLNVWDARPHQTILEVSC